MAILQRFPLIRESSYKIFDKLDCFMLYFPQQEPSLEIELLFSKMITKLPIFNRIFQAASIR